VSRNNFYDWRLEACLYFSLIHCSLLEVVYTILQFSFNMKMLFFPPTMANKWKKGCLLLFIHVSCCCKRQQHKMLFFIFLTKHVQEREHAAFQNRNFPYWKNFILLSILVSFISISFRCWTLIGTDGNSEKLVTKTKKILLCINFDESHVVNFFENCEFLRLCLSVTSWLNCKTINRALTNHIVQLTVLRIKLENCKKKYIFVCEISLRENRKKKIDNGKLYAYVRWVFFPSYTPFLLSSFSHIKKYNFHLRAVNEK